jgi:uncharacterized protein (DUF1778 family)
MSLRNMQGDSSMGLQNSHRPDMELQLSESFRRKVEEMAAREGISIEDFVLYAVAEKIARAEMPEKPENR